MKKCSKSNKKSLLKIFLISVVVTLVVSVGVIFAMVFTYNGMVVRSQTVFNNKDNLTPEQAIAERRKEERGELNKTIAVFGVDKEGLHTDTILVINFNTSTNKIKILSIPRDTRVDWNDRQQEKYKEITGYNKEFSKLNEMYNHGMVYKEPGNIRDFTIDSIEDILGVKIDNFVIVDMEAFKETVDTIGGVEVDVPRRMYYKDDSQGLYIDLEPGIQTLNGDTAEQFVRFRKTLSVGGEGEGYAEGDVGRIETQHIFLEAFANKVMSPEIINKLPSIVRTLFKYVKTDVELETVVEYLGLLKGFELENMEICTAPGNSEQDSYDGKWYFYIDYDELEVLIDDMFYDTTNVDEDNVNKDNVVKQEEILIDKEVSIGIYNNTNINGLASKLKNALVEDGYNVDKLGNYEGDDVDTTIILAKSESRGEQFKDYLSSDAIVKIDESIDGDIIIVISEDLPLNVE